MTTLTVEFPEIVAQQIEDQGYSTDELKTMIVQLVEEYLQKNPNHRADKQKWTSGSKFAQRLISNNRELFERLAQL